MVDRYSQTSHGQNLAWLLRLLAVRVAEAKISLAVVVLASRINVIIGTWGLTMRRKIWGFGRKCTAVWLTVNLSE